MKSIALTGLVAPLVTLLTVGDAAAVAQGGSISSRPTFDCARAKSLLAQLICSEEETNRADWDLKTAYYAGYFS